MESPREVWTLILGSVEAPGQSLPIPRGVCGILGGERLEVLLGKANPAAPQGFHCSLELPPQTPGSASSNPWSCLLKALDLHVFHAVELAAHTSERISWLLGSQAVKLHCLANELMRGNERKAKKRQEKATLPLGAWLEQGREGAGVGRSFRIRKVKSRSEEIEREVPGWCWWKGRAIAFFPSHSQKGSIWGVWNVGRVLSF